MTRADVVEWARDIYDDIDFTVVRRWLAEHPCGADDARRAPVGLRGYGF